MYKSGGILLAFVEQCMHILRVGHLQRMRMEARSVLKQRKPVRGQYLSIADCRCVHLIQITLSSEQAYV